MSLLLKNALIFDPTSPFHGKSCDLLIEKGVISSFRGTKAKKVVDLNGKMVTVGWFDLNSNFNDPGNEHKEDLSSGSKAAAFGGFTDVNLLPSTSPPIESKSAVEYVMTRPSEVVSLHVSAALSEGLKGENLTEVLDLHNSGACSFSDGDEPIWNTELLLKALQYTSQIGVSVMQNARDRHLSKGSHMHEGKESTLLGLRGEASLSEELMIMRDLEVLRYTGGRIHFSKISTKKSVELVKKAKKEGLEVTADVAIHHLLFTDSDLQGFDTNFKSLPPFRLDSDRKALLKGLKEGVIDAICSNHRPQDQESKQLEFDLADPGSISLQTFYPALLSLEKDIPFDVIVERITNAPRAILGIDKISIQEGAPAKLTILNPDKEWVLDGETNLSKSTNSPFWEQQLTGKVFGTVNINSYNFFD